MFCKKYAKNFAAKIGIYFCSPKKSEEKFILFYFLFFPSSVKY